MPRRGAPEINAGSMADIAFLLLIFFLVTTTMDKEAGMMRMLPELETEKPEPVNRRNVIDVLVNDNNQVLLKGELVEVKEIQSRLAEIIINDDNAENWPENIDVERTELEELLAVKKAAFTADPSSKQATNEYENAILRLRAKDLFGSMFKKSKHVVSIQSTRGAEYETYVAVSDQILLAYKELREKAVQKKLNKSWEELNKEEKRMMVLMYQPKVSEAETVSGK